MSKTTVLLDFGSGPSTVVLPATVYIRAVSVFASGNKIILPAPSPVPLDSAGLGSVALDDGVVWGFVVSVPSYRSVEDFRYVHASTTTVQYKDLLAVSPPPASEFGVPEWVNSVLNAVTSSQNAEEGATLSAANAVESAKSAAASAASIARGGANGVAPLDGAALLPEANVPTRLTSTQLSATFADPQALNLQYYNTPGSGVDRTAALQSLLTDAAIALDASGPRKHDGSFGAVTRLVEVPSGVWEISNFITVPETVSVFMHPNAVIRARATIAGAMIRTPVGKSWRGQFFMGGTIDCNQLADDGLLVNIGSKSRVEHLTVQDFKRYGVYIGTTGEIGSSFELGLTDVIPARRLGLTPPDGSVGIYINNASDCSFDKVNPVGAQRSFLINGGNHKFSRCHGWGYPGAFPEIIFDDRGGAFNTYFQCAADSPSVAGWHLESGYSYLDGCTLLIHPTQADNTVVGVRLASGAVSLRAVGCRFQGADSTHRLAADFKSMGDSSWLNTSTILGQETFSSVIRTAQRNMMPPYSVVGQVVERSLYVTGSVTATDLPPSIFWSVPVQADSVVIRAGSGTGTQFQIWQGGTQLTPTFGLGDVVTLSSPFSTGSPVKLAAFAGLYIKVTAAGTGANFTAVFKAYQNG